jgi:hypothetical protein
MPHRVGTLKAREFVFYCEDLAMAQLGGAVPPPERRVMWTILQLHYGDPTVHFELQPQVGRRLVEVGLHFEGPPEVNEARAALVAARADEIAATLGADWELEEWTPSWRRLHRSFPFERLDAALARDVAGQFAGLVIALQPVVAGFEPAPAVQRTPPAGRHERRRFAGRR